MGLRTLSAEFPAVPISEHEEIKIRLGEQIEASLSYFHCSTSATSSPLRRGSRSPARLLARHQRL